MDGGHLVARQAQEAADERAALHAYMVVLGRGVGAGAELDQAVRDTPAALLGRLYRSAEFRAAVVTPTLAQGGLPADRFPAPPDLEALEWLVGCAPLEAPARLLLLAARSWRDVHRNLAADPAFVAHVGPRRLDWPLEDFRRALGRIPREPRRDGGGRLRIEVDASRPEAERIDDAAMLRLSTLPVEHLAVLFDLKHILRRSGQRFGSPDEAMAAYFSEPAADRFSSTPIFAADHYAQGLGWGAPWEIDPFSHFLARVEQGGGDPHRLVSLKTVRGGSASATGVLERLCDLVLGEVDGPIHPLLHLPYIRAQAGAQELSCGEILTLACAEGPLPFSPHPLFCLREYGRRNATGGENELLHYLRSGRGALRTHPLLSPPYIQAARPDARAGPRRSLLEAYLETWPDKPVDPSIFVDVKHLNHQFAWRGEAGDADPLSRAVSAGVSDAVMLHPDLDSRLLAFAFGDLSVSQAAPELLRAAFDLPAQPKPGVGGPLISVVMVTYGKPVYTALSVLAALRALAPVPHEILVVENGGEFIHHEELLRLFAPHPSVRMVKLEANRYFGEGSNIGVDLACGEYVLFLNNDCLLAPDYGRQLQRLLCEDERRFDALGAALVFPNGDIQEFGGTVSDDGQVLQRAKHLPPSFLDSLPELEPADYASATCLCLSRRALDRVGGFDPLFEPFYFEDTDLCRRLGKAGLAINVSSRLRAMHVENGTTREFLGAGFNAQIARNREAFARRWLKRGGEDAYLRPPAEIRMAGSERPSALVYTPFDITPGGGERYLLSAARKLSETHEVVLATPRRMSRARVEFTRHALGVAPFAFRIGQADEVVGREGPFDIAFVMGNEIAPPIGPVARLNLYHLQFPFPWRTVGRTQFDRLQGFDAILVNSGYTAHWTRERLREAGIDAPPPVEILAPPVQALPRLARIPRSEMSPVRLANVGRFFTGGHCKRQDVFLQVVAGLRARGVATVGTLLGSVSCTGTAEAYFSDVQSRAAALGGVDVVRNAGRGEIAEALARADVYLHCCGFGVDTSLEPEAAEHFGISVVEAIQAGCYPVVVDAGGPVQLVDQAGRGAVYATVEGAVDAVQAALSAGRLDSPAPEALGEISDRSFDRALGLRLHGAREMAA